MGFDAVTALSSSFPTWSRFGRSCWRLSNWAPSSFPRLRCLRSTICATALIAAKARHVITIPGLTEKFASLGGDYTRILVGGAEPGWVPYAQAYEQSPDFTPDGETNATDPFMLYFTSGTTALPKLVLHTHQSYPVGHLATMYWIGIRPDDIHLNISTPGWAKHAWSSFFAPWNAGATIFVHNYDRFSAKRTLEVVARCGVTSMCAPPTVWRLFILEDLKSFPVKLKELASAGEPLNPEVIERVRAAWNITIRDGFGQTENVLPLGNFPGQMVKPGAVGKPSPGHRVVLLDVEGNESDDGEIAVKCDPKPISLMVGYVDDEERTAQNVLPEVTTAPATWRTAMPMVTSPTSAAPTTSSRVPIIASARSNWRAR